MIAIAHRTRKNVNRDRKAPKKFDTVVGGLAAVSIVSESISLSSSLGGHFSVLGLTVSGASGGIAETAPLPIATSAQARNSSCS